MAYFSNSTEGLVLEVLCDKCIHGWDGEQDRQGKPCAVMMLQMQWNYDQCNRVKRGSIKQEYGNVTTTHQIGELTREAVVMKQALDTLVPNRGDEICAMFVEVDDGDS